MTKEHEVLNISPRIITEIALGVQPPLDVLQRYDYSLQDAKKILANEVFQKRVQDERRALEQNDDIDRMFNRMCYRLVRDKLVSVAVSGSMPPADLVKTTDMLRKHAGLGDTVADASAPRAIINLQFTSNDNRRLVVNSDPDPLSLDLPQYVVERSDETAALRNSELEYTDDP